MSREKSDLDLWLTATYGDRVQREYRFHPTRRWRIDYAFPDLKVGIEYQGMFGGAAHTSITNVMRDSEKANEAQLHGWIILQVNGRSLRDGTAYGQIEQAVELRQSA